MSKKQKPMTFLKLNLLRALFMLVNGLLIVFIWGLFIDLCYMNDDLAEAIIIMLSSIVVWGDIFVFMKFKEDLFTEKYRDINSQWIFQVMLVIDFIAAPVLVIWGIVKIIQCLI